MPRLIQVPTKLQVHPEISRRTQELCKAKRRAGSHSPPLVHELIDPLIGTSQYRVPILSPGWHSARSLVNLPGACTGGIRTMEGETGRQRVIIEGVEPEIDCGRFPVKRTVGERVRVEADAFTDGHDAVTVRLLWRPESQEKWREAAMEPLGNDRWRAEFTPKEQGRWVYTVTAWVDRFKTWRRDLKKRVDAGQ